MELRSTTSRREGKLEIYEKLRTFVSGDSSGKIREELLSQIEKGPEQNRPASDSDVEATSRRHQGKLEIYQKLRTFLRDNDGDDNRKIREEFLSQIEKGNSLNVAVLLQDDLPTIQALYESQPENLQVHTLHLACKYGAKEGVVSYLVGLRGPEFFEARIGGMGCSEGPFPYLRLAIDANVPEADIKTLVEISPELVIEKYWWLGDDHRDYNKIALQKCMEKGYSSDLIDFMIERIPENIKWFSFPDNTTITERDLKWIEPIFENCNKEIHIGSFDWQGPGFHRFLGACFFQTPKLKELKIFLRGPTGIDSDDDSDNDSSSDDDDDDDDIDIDGAETSMQQFDDDDSSPDDDSDDDIDQAELSMRQFKETYLAEDHLDLHHHKIKSLDLGFRNSAYCGILDVLPHWPCLRELELFVGDVLEPSLPALCRLLGDQGKLQTLTLRATAKAIRSSRKRNSSGEVRLPLRPLFDAMATNKTVRTLSISGYKRTVRTLASGYTDVDFENIGLGGDEQLQAYFDPIMNMLKQNTTLIYVKDFLGRNWCDFEERFAESPTEIQIDDQIWYYTDLNCIGRRDVARDESTTLEEFVRVLGCTVQREHGSPKLRPEAFLSILYGFLHEGISKWGHS